MLRLILPFLGLLRGKERRLLVLFGVGLAGSAASLASPLIGKAFVDAVATRRDFAAVPAIAAALVALAMLDLLLGTAVRLVHTRLSADLLNELRARLFGRCLEGPLEHAEAFRHGDLLCRFGTDAPQVQALLLDALIGGVQNLLFLVVAAGILVRLSAPLALWSFGGVAVALAASGWFRRPVEARTGEIRGLMAALSHFLAERLGALRQIRFHRTEEAELGRLTALNARLADRVVAFQWFDTVAAGLPGLALTLGLAWIYVLGGRLLETRAIGLGTFVAFVLYQGRLYGPARGLLGLVRSLQEGRVSLRRVGEVLSGTGDTPLAGGDPGGAPPAELEAGEVRVEDVTFAYPGKAPVLRGLSLTLRPGEKTAIFGRSGAGKSTLVQLLFGLRAPAGGRVETGGGQGAGRPGLGYAGAEPFLLHASLEENVRYARADAPREAVLRAAAVAELHELALSLPHGYDTVIGGRGLALSDGQRQRVGIARLVLQDPSILVLDEAFSGLDLETERRIRTNLREAFADRTLLVISHRPVGLEEFDRILFLRDGRLSLVAPGELRELLLHGSREKSCTSPWLEGEEHVPDSAH
ncbi:MAG: ABC transporter ATP-binding protein [Deltaproteobacteria bacterium]|nr:ABC transporter ATP-binding protein [Deltaproteobacteria bacterium]